jgi:signal transduction histidine kinase
MRNAMPMERLQPWEERWRPVVLIGPYVLLAVLIGYTAYAHRGAPAALAVDLALCGVALAAMLWMFTLHPAWRIRPGIMAAFFVVIAAVTIVLVFRDPWFGFFCPAGYMYAFSVLPWPWELAGVAAIGFAAGTAQTSGIARTTGLGLAIWIAVVLANVLPISGLAWMGWSSDVQTARREHQFDEVSEAKRQLEVTLAENAGLHRQLVVQAREAGVLDERARMAREIHDTIAQGLAGIVTQLQAAEQAEADPARWRRHVAAAIDLARDSLTEARRSVHELRPEPLATMRLTEALDDVADRFTALHAVPVEVETAGTVRPLAPEAQVALLRTAQEALANVAKHAHASRVTMTLSYLDQEVALDVCDDGRGFDPADRPAHAPESGGFGLIAMRERIEGLFGALRIESAPERGTTVSARIPDAPVEVAA